ncbi:MFS transporter, FSR family, fosmidomycin resistance protein [Desulfotomaculum arcticum]|uniref:MFS transporter, FSR family, fosmidomycin resistance protein n=1 Tax=Desulfotruncus arcticus DSM 17038 TaxID=1121424 RepID=A0A1I2QKJ7_9FIRM|nr:MFS transporter [Desulfotruncus arcticus]SFG26226.1 MFS transporter, FSR family, fosmidomycin resistance protein [Desulfotomaculum arcticum] [Desulfotruncus arcticus DSM 17038]
MNKKVLALLSTGHVVTDLNQGALPMMLAFLQPAFSLTQLQVGIVMLAFNLSSSVIQPVFGVLSDRFTAYWLIPTGCLLAGLGMSLTGFSPNYHMLLLAALVSGLGIAAFHPESSKYSRFASGPRKATGMSLFSVGGNAGFAAGPVLATYFFGLAGLRGSSGFLALNGLMALILLFYLSTITGTGPQKTRVTATDYHQDNLPEPADPLTFKLLLPVILLVLVVIMRSWVHFGLVTYLPQYYVHYLHRSETYAATLTSVFLFAGAFGTLTGGPLADRWGLKNVVVTSMALMIPLLYLFVRLGSDWTPAVVAMLGFIIISTFAVTVVFSQELLPNNVGLASGLIMGFAIGMGGVGATLLGYIADLWGLPAVFQVMMVFPVIGLILALFLPGKKEITRRNLAEG